MEAFNSQLKQAAQAVDMNRRILTIAQKLSYRAEMVQASLTGPKHANYLKCSSQEDWLLLVVVLQSQEYLIYNNVLDILSDALIHLVLDKLVNAYKPAKSDILPHMLKNARELQDFVNHALCHPLLKVLILKKNL